VKDWWIICHSFCLFFYNFSYLFLAGQVLSILVFWVVEYSMHRSFPIVVFDGYLILISSITAGSAGLISKHNLLGKKYLILKIINSSWLNYYHSKSILDVLSAIIWSWWQDGGSIWIFFELSLRPFWPRASLLIYWVKSLPPYRLSWILRDRWFLRFE
jgi:hypothetical protein